MDLPPVVKVCICFLGDTLYIFLKIMETKDLTHLTTHYWQCKSYQTSQSNETLSENLALFFSPNKCANI